MDGDSSVLDHVDDRVIQTCGNEVFRASRVVSGIKVILAIGHDLNGGKRTWPLSRVHDRHSKLRAGDVAFNECSLVIGEARDHGRPQLVRRRRVGHAESRAPLMRFHHDRKTQVTRDDGQHFLGSQLTEVGMWKSQ